jgi:hypothetical protein
MRTATTASGSRQPHASNGVALSGSAVGLFWSAPLWGPSAAAGDVFVGSLRDAGAFSGRPQLGHATA